MTDPTERLAEAVEKWIADHHADNDRIDSLAVKGLCASLAAQGFGHQDNILRAFADHLEQLAADKAIDKRWMGGLVIIDYDGMADRYLASLAAKEEER